MLSIHQTTGQREWTSNFDCLRKYTFYYMIEGTRPIHERAHYKGTKELGTMTLKLEGAHNHMRSH